MIGIGENEAVDAVDDAAVAGEEFAGVFDADVALEHREDEVAKQAHHADDKTDDRDSSVAEVACRKLGHQRDERHRDAGNDHGGADSGRPGFVRTHFIRRYGIPAFDRTGPSLRAFGDSCERLADPEGEQVADLGQCKAEHQNDRAHVDHEQAVAQVVDEEEEADRHDAE